MEVFFFLTKEIIMKGVSESTVLLAVIIAIVVFSNIVLFSMSEVHKREHELKMKCTNLNASNTPICLKAAYKN